MDASKKDSQKKKEEDLSPGKSAPKEDLGEKKEKKTSVKEIGEKKKTPETLTPPPEKKTPPSATVMETPLAEEEEDEELLVENDGDFFWILQKAVWMIVKILLTIGIIAFVVWIIWGNRDSDSLAPLSDPFSQTQKETSEKETPPMPSPAKKTEEDSGTLWPFSKPKNEEGQPSPVSFVGRDDIDRYMDWLVRVRYFFQTQLNINSWGTDIGERTQKMNVFLSDIRDLVLESDALRKNLSAKVDIYAQNIEQQNKLSQYHTQRLNEALESIQPAPAANHLFQKIEAQTESQKNYSLYEANRYVLYVMEAYDKSLRELYHKAFTNKQAIIHNIQVMYFEADPFQRVLLPAQWKESRR